MTEIERVVGRIIFGNTAWPRNEAAKSLTTSVASLLPETTISYEACMSYLTFMMNAKSNANREWLRCLLLPADEFSLTHRVFTMVKRTDTGLHPTFTCGLSRDETSATYRINIEYQAQLAGDISTAKAFPVYHVCMDTHLCILSKNRSVNLPVAKVIDTFILRMCHLHSIKVYSGLLTTLRQFSVLTTPSAMRQLCTACEAIYKERRVCAVRR